MARFDVFRRIKNEKSLKDEYRNTGFNFDYLKMMKYSEFKVNRDFYSSWHLNKVKTLSFNKWFKERTKLI